jgi:hypothetical protein
VRGLRCKTRHSSVLRWWFGNRRAASAGQRSACAVPPDQIVA